jgi:hypothetical protein
MAVVTIRLERATMESTQSCSILFPESYFPWAGVANGKWQIESHYPTQAKYGLNGAPTICYR